jgi:hypothetical protein
MVHHYVFMNQAESFGKVVQDTFSRLQEFAGWVCLCFVWELYKESTQFPFKGRRIDHARKVNALCKREQNHK